MRPELLRLQAPRRERDAIQKIPSSAPPALLQALLGHQWTLFRGRPQEPYRKAEDRQNRSGGAACSRAGSGAYRAMVNMLRLSDNPTFSTRTTRRRYANTTAIGLGRTTRPIWFLLAQRKSLMGRVLVRLHLRQQFPEAVHNSGCGRLDRCPPRAQFQRREPESLGHGFTGTGFTVVSAFEHGAHPEVVRNRSIVSIVHARNT